jgi:hypothetical protein
MPQKIEEDTNIWRVRVQDPSSMDKFRVKELGKGVKMTFGRIKGTRRWEVQNYMFEKGRFKTKKQVSMWLDQHLKAEIKTLLDFKAWNEFRRQAVNTYVQISQVTSE